MNNSVTWLLLLYTLPTKQNTERVAVWRKLKKFGAVPIKTSAYLLPDQPAHYERFQWLTQQIRDHSGDATLVRAREIEGMPNEKLVELFNQAREKEYQEVGKALRGIAGKGADPETASAELERLRRQFRQIREIDFFDNPAAQDVEMLFRRAEGGRSAKKPRPKLDAKSYRGKTWLTRRRPEIDRVGSAWLIRKFIDPGAKFLFAAAAPVNREAIPFDMLDAEFSHHGNDCTFETLAKRFAIQDKAVSRIGEMIHDADVEDSRFQRTECVGLDRVFKGWGKHGISDEEILARGFQCFDGLYTFLQRR